MKVIKNGYYPEYPKQCECNDCHSIIEVDGDDVMNRPFEDMDGNKLFNELPYYHYFKCPVCGLEIEVK